jgi:hypothetical protein
LVAFVTLALAAHPARGGEPPFPSVQDLESASALLAAGVRNPADVIRFRGRYVVTELLTNRLAVFDYPQFDGFEHFDPATIGRAFESPHYLAVSPTGGLLISNGWGSSIVQIDDLDGSGWTSFSGKNRKFKAPHGICVDEDGWIYVGDSLNSRLVRFRDMSGRDWQVFEDLDRRISYIRKLVCRKDGVWASNSYEDRPELNRGEGSNVLRISDFASGRAEVLHAIEHANITGIWPLSDERLLVGVWGKEVKVGIVELGLGSLSLVPGFRKGLGVPYGFWLDEDAGVLFVAHTGALRAGDSRTGGIAVHGRSVAACFRCGN